jgi:hypothetical protein
MGDESKRVRHLPEEESVPDVLKKKLQKLKFCG